MSVRAFLVSCLLFTWINVASASSIKVITQSPDFFENVVLDSLLLMDRGLQQILSSDIAYLVKRAHFAPQPNSWIPKPHPKGRLSTIYNGITNQNLEDSFTSMVALVVEMSCLPRQYDPLNGSVSKCISKTLKYPVIETMQIDYNYLPGKSFDELVAHAKSTDADRYQNIVRTLADLMNSGYQKTTDVFVAKNVNVIKFPLPLVATSTATMQNGTLGGMTNDDIKNEKVLLEGELDHKRIECTDVKHSKYQRESCDKAKDEIRNLIKILEINPKEYFAYKQARIANEMARSSERLPTKALLSDDYKQVKQQEDQTTKKPAGNFELRDNMGIITSRGTVNNNGNVEIRDGYGNLTGRGHVNSSGTGDLRNNAGDVIGQVNSGNVRTYDKMGVTTNQTSIFK